MTLRYNANLVSEGAIKDSEGNKITTTYAKSASLATVATSGDYTDLSNTPTIPAAQVQADWNETDTTSMAYIQNKPTIPSNYVTTNTQQNITGEKTIVGDKKLILKQNSATDKTGFTLYSYNNRQQGALELRPNTINGAPLLTLNSPGASGGAYNNETSYLGFRYWTPTKNLIFPIPSNINTNIRTSGEQTFYFVLGVTDGTNYVTTSSDGVVNISSLLPTVPTIATSVDSTSTNSETVGAKLFYDTVGNIETLINAL